MSKILTTQLTGLFQRIEKTEEEMIHDSARILAQAAVSGGTIYFACYDELQAVVYNALDSIVPFKNAAAYRDDIQLTSTDRIIIFTRSCSNPKALQLATELNKAFVPFAAIATEMASEENELSTLAYAYISLKIKNGLLPHPEKIGERIVFPHLLAALYIYEAIKMEYDEMIQEDEIEFEDLTEESPLSAEQLHQK